jgi:hypothetical protein
MRALGSTIARYSVANDATAEHPSKRCEKLERNTRLCRGHRDYPLPAHAGLDLLVAECAAQLDAWIDLLVKHSASARAQL